MATVHPRGTGMLLQKKFDRMMQKYQLKNTLSHRPIA